MHLVQQSSNQFYFEMILCDMSQIILHKYRNVCHVRHGNHSSRYPCNINVRPIDSNPFKYMLCISKTACFLVNCAPLSLQFGMNEEPKALKGLICRSAIIELHPQNRTRPHFGMQSLSHSAAFPPLSP